jgi:hypothetical protein
MDPALFLGQVRGRLRRSLMIEGMARILVMTIGLICAVITADYLWPTPGWFRLAALLAIIGAIGYGVRSRLARPLLKSMDDRALAQFVERRLPGLDGRLLTVIDGIPLAGEKPLLESALTSEAVRSLVPARTLPRWVSSALTVLIAVAAIGMLFPRFAQDACGRMFIPLGSTQWARGTTLEGHLEQAVVASDRKPMLDIERHHWRDSHDDPSYQAPVTVNWEAIDGPAIGRTGARQLPGMHGTNWQASLPALPPGHWRISVESGDAEPLVLVVRSVARPSLTQVLATVEPPAYSKLPTLHLPTLACTALPGSHIHFSVTFAGETDRHIDTVTASVSSQGKTQPLPLVRQDGGFSSGLTVPVGSPQEIILTAADEDGISVDPPPTFTITPQEDRAPTVSLSGPMMSETVAPHAVVAIAIDASDDFALALLELHAQVSVVPPAGAEAPPAAGKRSTIAAFPDAAGAAATTRHASADIATLAALGDQVLLTGYATDANTISGPGVSTSAPILLRVVSEEALRQELDRLLSEARERASQAREEIGAGLASPAKLSAQARSAALAASKCTELVDQVLRRWSENRLDAQRIIPATQAGVVLHHDVAPQLSAAANGGGETAARAGDAALAKVEKLLSSMLQEGDLTHRLIDIMTKQEHLNAESRTFVLDHLTQALDDAAKASQANIVERQLGVAEEMKDLERQILANTAPQLAAARKLTTEQPIGEHLSDAADQVASDTQRPQAVQTQQAALAAMKKLLESLRGGDAAGELSDRVGALAAEQENIEKDLTAGKRPQDLLTREQDLKSATERLQAEVAARAAEAGKAMAAAAESAGATSSDMQKGSSESAGSDAAAAANLLREAQKLLSGDNDPEKAKKDPKKDPDIVALLHELLSLQTQLLADATPLHLTLGEKPLDFSGSRAVSALGGRQSDILLRLREEAMKPLEKNLLATVGLNRVAVAMQKTVDHLQTPALGARGIRLIKISLAELSRLVDIAETPPPPSQPSSGQGGGGNAAPFPAQAEIALLVSMQQELSRMTDADRPSDVAKGQADLRDLVQQLEQGSRPGSRPTVLLSRTRRAMASAAALLADHDRGLDTRHEQLDAEMELKRMLAEMGSGGGGGGGQGSGGRSRQQPRPGSPTPAPPSAAQPAPSGAGSGSGNKSGGKPGDSTVVATPDTGAGMRLDLPEEKREQLKQARQENLAPRAMQLYERYLELLEDKP